MINSINSGSTDWYSRKRNYMVDEIVSAATSKVTNAVAVDTDSSEETDASVTISKSRTNMSLEDSMKKMQGGKMPPPPPPMDETSDETTDSTVALKTSTTTSSTGELGDIDADGDGTLSSDEYETMISQMGISDGTSAEDFFAQYDTDGDGEITKDEMNAARPTMGPPPMGMPPQDKSSQILPSDIDADGDGSLSSDEYETLMEELGLGNASTSNDFFNQYDTDEDGEITSTEMDSFAAQALKAYQQNFQFMFNQEEGLINSKA